MAPVSSIGYGSVCSKGVDGGCPRVFVAMAASRIKKTQAVKIYHMSRGKPKILVLRLNNDNSG
jgi:hypothetical protein